jgi:hypothetical protein
MVRGEKMAEIFWIIIASPTFIIPTVVGIMYLCGKGYFNFRAKKKFELKTKELPWQK